MDRDQQQNEELYSLGRPVFLIENYNRLWASLWVNTAIAYQVRDFVVAPGMRNLPLIAAAKAHPLANVITGFDERSLAFYSIGLVKATGRPVALIATSGSAGAHFLPALEEAYLQELPLVVVSADRPKEMAQTNCNQSLPASDLFSPFLVGKLDLEAPNSELALNGLQSIFKKLMVQALGLLGDKHPGPVHLNFPFRGPLDRTGEKIHPSRFQELNFFSQYPQLHTAVSATRKDQWELPTAWGDLDWRHTLLVIGELDYRVNVGAFARGLAHWPLPFLADITSSMASSHHLAVPSCDYHRVQAFFAQVKTIIHVGGKITSKYYYQEIRQRQIPVHLITNNRHWTDPAFFLASITVGDLNWWWDKCSLPSPETETDLAVAKLRPPGSFPHFSGVNWVAKEILQAIPQNTTLFLGNSSIIRIFDLVAAFLPQKLVRICSQRGVSGVDGNISHSLALADERNFPVTAVIGDWATIHDLNAFSLLAHLQLAFSYILIIFNNSGGKIFELLGPNEDESVLELLAQNHQYQFDSLATMFHLPYFHVENLDSFTTIYQHCLEIKGASIIEIELDQEMMKEWNQLKKW